MINNIRLLIKYLIYPIGYLVSKILEIKNFWCFVSIRYSVGDTLCLTAVIRELKIELPQIKIVIITNKPEIFKNNPHVYKIIPINLKNFFGIVLREILLSANFSRIVFFRNPSTHFGSLKNIKKIDEKSPQHLVFIHSNHFKRKINIKKIEPEIFLDESDCMSITFSKKYTKRILITSTGKTDVTNNKNYYFNEIQSLVDKLKINSTIEIYQVGLFDDQILNNVIDLRGNTNLRQLFWLVSKIDLIISTEGLLNHISAAFNKPSIVLDSGFTSREFFSYKNTYLVERNDNIDCMPCWMIEDCLNKVCMKHLSANKISLLALNILFKGE